MGLKDIGDAVFLGISVGCNGKGVSVLMDMDYVEIGDGLFKMAYQANRCVDCQLVFEVVGQVLEVEHPDAVDIDIVIVFEFQSFIATVCGVDADVMSVFHLLFCNLIRCIHDPSVRKAGGK